MASTRPDGHYSTNRLLRLVFLSIHCPEAKFRLKKQQYQKKPTRWSLFRWHLMEAEMNPSASVLKDARTRRSADEIAPLAAQSKSHCDDIRLAEEPTEAKKQWTMNPIRGENREVVAVSAKDACKWPPAPFSLIRHCQNVSHLSAVHPRFTSRSNVEKKWSTRILPKKQQCRKIQLDGCVTQYWNRNHVDAVASIVEKKREIERKKILVLFLFSWGAWNSWMHNKETTSYTGLSLADGDTRHCRPMTDSIIGSIPSLRYRIRWIRF